RYINGEATVKERQKVKEKKAADPDFRARLGNVQKMWASPVEIKINWDVDDAWNQYIEQFGNPYEKKFADPVSVNRINDAKKSQNIQNVGIRPVIYRLGIVAAAAAAALLFVFLFYQ